MLLPVLLRTTLISAVVSLTGMAATSAPVPTATAVTAPSLQLAEAQLPQVSQPAQIAQSFQSLERSVHEQINQYRRSKGLPVLTLNPTISQQSLQHSQAMANGRVPFSHNGFEQRVQTIQRTIPLRGAAENVAYNKGYKDPAQQAVQGWLKSPGHLKNIVGNYNLTGIGVARNAKGEYYFTQVFVLRR